MRAPLTGKMLKTQHLRVRKALARAPPNAECFHRCSTLVCGAARVGARL